MSLPKIVIMDLGNTIIKNYKIDFSLGLKYLYEHYTHQRIPLAEVLNDGMLIKTGYDNRQLNDLEINFHNYLRYLDQVVGFREGVSYEKLEKEFIDIAFEETLIDGVRDFLEYLKSHQIPVYVLSNSTFSKTGLVAELAKFKVLEYFQDVYSSADYLFRKPHPIFFKMITKNLQEKYKVELSELWYVGNDYYFDVQGSQNAGMMSVWLNTEDEPNSLQLPCITVKNYHELIEILESGEIVE